MGKSHPKCYARSLNDCSDKISREHYISRTVLEQIKDGLTVSGFPWQEAGERTGVSPSSLTAKILCERHNLALSHLDSQGGRLYRTLDGFNGGFLDSLSKPIDESALFSGRDVEKWILKVLCGGIASGSLRASGAQVSPEIDPVWLDLLFDRKLDWPKGWGFHVVTATTEPIHAYRGLAFEPVFDPNKEKILGVSVAPIGVSFVLTMTTPNYGTGSPIQEGSFRPRRIVFSKPGMMAKKVIEFTWDGRGGGCVIQMVHAGSRRGIFPDRIK